MTTPPVRVERRAGQRFPFNLPVTLNDLSGGVKGVGFTQDVSSRGVFFFTDMALTPASEIELTLKMPSEITLGESMLVRCKGRILRVVGPVPAAHYLRPAKGVLDDLHSSRMEDSGTPASAIAQETKIGVAVCLSGYEYLPDTEDASRELRRISALHTSPREQDSPTPDAIG